MSYQPTIRAAGPGDLENLQDLYAQMTLNQQRCPPEIATDILTRFEKYDGSAILLAEIDKTLITSCALIIVPNLTRGGAPFALIENVVTDTGHRRQGYGKLILNAAADRAWQRGCYKVMLLAGSLEPSILSFYTGAGFTQSKTGFQMRRSPKRTA